MPPLYTRYRPTCFEDVIGQDDVIRRITDIRDSDGLDGRSYFIFGPSGCGKTTIAKLIANEVADRYVQHELDALDLTIDRVARFEEMCHYRPLAVKPNYCFVVNEVHNARTNIISKLQTLLEDEDVQATSTWVFTTTDKGQQRMFDTRFDAVPFLSRCLKFEVRHNDVAFGRRLWEIGQETGLGNVELADYVKCVKRCNGNMREALHRLEAGELWVERLEDDLSDMVAWMKGETN